MSRSCPPQHLCLSFVSLKETPSLLRGRPESGVVSAKATRYFVHGVAVSIGITCIALISTKAFFHARRNGKSVSQKL